MADRIEGDDRHVRAAQAFADTVEGNGTSGVEELYLFGSTARRDAAGLSSDVDFLVVVSEAADRDSVEERLRDIAYDVMLEYGPVVEVHVLSRAEFETRRKEGNPFVRRVLSEGRSYA